MIYLKSDGIVLGQSKDVSTTLHELSTLERGSANVAEELLVAAIWHLRVQAEDELF